MDKPLSTSDVLKIAGIKNFKIFNNVIHSANRKVLTKKILAQYQPKSNIVQELFTPKNMEHFLIHYQTGGDYKSMKGHWTCFIVDNVRKHLLFFDSYGIFPDNQLNYIEEEIRDETKQLDRDIGKMLYVFSTYGFKIFYNNIKFQKEGSNTCGRYCGLLFSISKNQIIHPEKFKSLLDTFAYYGNYDEIVIQLSQNLL